MFSQEPFTLTSYSPLNHILSDDRTEVSGLYKQAHGQFMLSQELTYGTSFNLTLHGFGVVKMNTFPSIQAAFEWIRSDSPLRTHCQRIRSKLFTTIHFAAVVKEELEFSPSRIEREASPRRKFTLPLLGPNTVLAFDIECGDVKVCVTNVQSLSNVVNVLGVFHPLHATHLKLKRVPNGSQVNLNAPAPQSLVTVDGDPLTPHNVLTLNVEGSSQERDTGGYFRLWVCRGSQENNEEATAEQQQEDSSSSAKPYSCKNSSIFPIQPCTFQTYLVVVKPNQLLITHSSDSKVTCVIKDDFQQYSYTLWVEFYKVAFCLLKTGLSWDWMDQDESALGPGIQNTDYARNNIWCMDCSPEEPQPLSEMTAMFPNLQLSQGANASHQIYPPGFVCPRNEALNPLDMNQNILIPSAEGGNTNVNGNSILNHPLPSIPSNENYEEPRPLPHYRRDEGSYLSILSRTNLSPSTQGPNSMFNREYVSAPDDTVPKTAPIPCPSPRAKARSKTVSNASPLKAVTRVLSSIRKPRSNSTSQRKAPSPPDKNDEFVNHGFFDPDDIQTPVNPPYPVRDNSPSPDRMLFDEFQHLSSMRRGSSLSRNDSECSFGSFGSFGPEGHHYEEIENDVLKSNLMSSFAINRRSEKLSSYNSDENHHLTRVKQLSGL